EPLMTCRYPDMTSKPSGSVGSGQAHREAVFWVGGVRHGGGASLSQAFMRNHGNLSWDEKGKVTRAETRGRNTKAQHRGGALRRSEEAPVMGEEQRERVVPGMFSDQPAMGGTCE